MKRTLFALILAGLVLLAGMGFAFLSISRPASVDARTLMAANALAAAGHDAEAAQMYEQLIAQGAEDAALYYNLGNSTLLLGDATKAVAAYERAAALAPRDADIRTNLALAQKQAHGQTRKPSATALGDLADVTGRWLTVDELALLAMGAWLALGMLVFAYRGLLPERRPALLRAAMAITLLVVLATAGVLTSRMAAPRAASPATFMGQQAAGTTNISNPL